MFILETSADFDSAHFLAGYEGKCSNIHGHRWHITAQISGDVQDNGQERGMVMDFGTFKADLRAIADSLDHVLIYESGSLREKTLEALREENFRLYEVPFRPTAENLALYIYELLCEKAYSPVSVRVYETPTNSAEYRP
ncbi:MAG: 6-carboxytetrahydropterin synthase QueD [Oscillospiraceae bacterium]|nr:6-carboxytetrahydropterin synthase QueD [Oscillospiraceae bacterium]